MKSRRDNSILPRMSKCNILTGKKPRSAFFRPSEELNGRETPWHSACEFWLEIVLILCTKSERASTTLKESHSQPMESARGRHSNAAAALNPRRDALRRANFQVVKYKGFLLCRVPKGNADQGHSAHLHVGRSDFNDGYDALKICRKGEKDVF